MLRRSPSVPIPRRGRVESGRTRPRQRNPGSGTATAVRTATSSAASTPTRASLPLELADQPLHHTGRLLVAETESVRTLFTHEPADTVQEQHHRLGRPGLGVDLVAVQDLRQSVELNPAEPHGEFLHLVLDRLAVIAEGEEFEVQR